MGGVRGGIMLRSQRRRGSEMDISKMLEEMHGIYSADPVRAVRGQAFIKILHQYLSVELESRLTPAAKRRGTKVINEATIFGSHKPKDVDVAVVDPENGPLLMVGVRSQMSSIAKNALNYYEGIIGECISIQDRFPMSVIGYIYLMPVRPIKEGREGEVIDHARYAHMYDAITGREGQVYKDIRGIFDHFAYLIVDFDGTPPDLRDDLLPGDMQHDLHIETFAERMIQTFKSRHIFVDVFT